MSILPDRINKLFKEEFSQSFPSWVIDRIKKDFFEYDDYFNVKEPKLKKSNKLLQVIALLIVYYGEKLI